MKCPVCLDADLMMSERLGIEIDYCPKCRGVWLDRGELDKILERSAREALPSFAADGRNAPRLDPNRFGNDHHQGGEHHRESYHGHAKKPFWKELFD